MKNSILGINRRNVEYIRPYNNARAKKIADDKLLSKKILSRHGIPTAEIFKIIRNKKQLDTMDWSKLPKSFALKPNEGTGGSGIIVFYGKQKSTRGGSASGRNETGWIRPDGSIMSISEIKTHVNNILEGQYSMGNKIDIAIIEERIINHPDLVPYSYRGVPDVRVIVFNSVPIMAELRLPTKQSDGKANLHAGGLGVGIDIATGITTIAIQRQSSNVLSDIYRLIDSTPDRNLPLRGIQIPHWREILEISVKCQRASGLGYAGVDIAIDRNKGPIVFELNARPGLAIQTANMSGLREKLERIKGLKIKDEKHGIRVAQNLFGGEVEDEVKLVSGRQIIGLVEKTSFHPYKDPEEMIKINLKPTKKHDKTKEDLKVKVQVDTGIRRSIISQRLATRLGYTEALKHFDSFDFPSKFDSREDARTVLEQNIEKIESHPQIIDTVIMNEEDCIRIRPVITVKFRVADQEIESNMAIAQSKSMPYPAVIGRNDLMNFLVDTSKTFSLH
ncbi:MAG: sugar-transfer associated ATP-grasp domain-containing protein [bacterium]